MVHIASAAPQTLDLPDATCNKLAASAAVFIPPNKGRYRVNSLQERRQLGQARALDRTRQGSLRQRGVDIQYEQYEGSQHLKLLIAVDLLGIEVHTVILNHKSDAAIPAAA